MVYSHTAIDIHTDSYLDHLTSLKYSPKSISSYKTNLRRFALFLSSCGIDRIQNVSLKDLEAYRLELVDQKYSDQSISLYLWDVKKLFKYLEETRQIFINPAAKLIVPKPSQKLMPIPTESEMITLLEMPDTSKPTGIRDRAIIETFYSTGIRLKELTQMNIPDIDFKKGRVRVTGKGSKERVVPLGRHAAEWTERYLVDVRPQFLRKKPENNALWLGFKGNKIHHLTVERFISEYGRNAAIHHPVTPHAIRRACATHMLRAGAHPVDLQMLLGHSDLRTLSRYLKVTINDLMKTHAKGSPGQ